MAFTKGKSGNPAGRPEGAKGKTTLEIREKVFEFVSSNIDDLQKSYDKLDANGKVKYLTILLQYTTPKMKDLEHRITHSK